MRNPGKVIREVEGFKEKPDLKTAEAYLAAGDIIGMPEFFCGM